MPASDLRPLLQPRSIAVIGASATPGKQGNVAIAYLKRAGFPGRIYPVNPAGGEIEGLTCYRSIRDVPEHVDCAFFVIPAQATAAALKECAEAGLRSAIIGSSGFAEMGSDEGRRRQTEILVIARSADMRLLGPNTNGLWNATACVSIGFNTSHGEPMTPGPISVVAHSGALFDSFLPRLRALGAGFSKLVPMGNEADLTMLEVVEHLIDDPVTGVIGLIVEAIHDGARLRAAADRARQAGKPIVALKLGRSRAGAAAALAHSSRLAGTARAYDALLQAAGIPCVGSIEAFAGALALIADKPPLDPALDFGVIGVSSSGGGCSLMADHAEERGIPLAGSGDGAWIGETAHLIASYEGTGLIRNPIDGGNLHGWTKLVDLIAAMERDGMMGPMVAFAHRLPSLAADMSLYTPLQARKQRTGSPVVVVSPGGLRAEMQERYHSASIPVFNDLPTGFDALAAVYALRTYAAERASTAAESTAPRLAPDRVAKIRDALQRARGRAFLTEMESAAILRTAGLPMVASTHVADVPAAVHAAEATGYPLVLKAITPGIAHKHDAGLVEVGIAGESALTAAWSRIGAKLAKLGQDADGVTIVLQPMVASRAEVIIGSTREPGLGHFLLVGLGGVNAELFDSAVLLPVPVAPDTIRNRVGQSAVGRLLTRLAERTGRDCVGDIVTALSGLQALLLAYPDDIQSIDVNPLLIGDEAAIAVDALIVPTSNS